ncbi:MAG: DUF1858 domain-containing protein [Eubacterium sp.]|nr:DUF1858 domain-containing protein [Eubacterium sp.]
MAEEIYNAGNADLENINAFPVDEDGIIQYVNKDMLIGDILKQYPDAALVLMKCGMHCITCSVSTYESLDQACAVHGLYTDDITKVLNDFLTQTLAGEAAEAQE